MTKRLTRAFLLQLEEGRGGKADEERWMEEDALLPYFYTYIYIERKPDGCRSGEQRTVRSK